MLLTTTTDVAGILPPDFGPLVIQPFFDQSITAMVATTVVTGAKAYRVPLVTADASAAFVEEGAEITPSQPTLAELTIVPTKCAGLTVISRELSEDSSPQALEIVGGSLSRDIARRVDESFFAGLAAPAPAGLTTLAGIQTVTEATAFENLDAFAESIALAETVGSTIDHFVVSPMTALTLSKVRVATGSNQMLLGQDATAAGQRRILGVPVLVSQYVADETAWAIDSSRVWLVVRSDATVETDSSVFFTKDSVAVKATMRVGVGVVHPASVIRVGVI